MTRPANIPWPGRVALVVALALAAPGCGDPEDGPGADPARGPGSPTSSSAASSIDGPPEVQEGPVWLVDVTAEAGVDFRHVHAGTGRKYLFETMGSGVAATDFDGDGRPDLLFLQSGTLPPEEFDDEEREAAPHAAGLPHALYRNEGDWRFTDVTEQSGLTTPCYAQGLAVGDIDADGDRDLFVGCYGRDRLYANDGRARFEEITSEAGVEDDRWGMGGAFLDVDLDGDLDLYTVSYLDMPVASHKRCGPNDDLRTYCHVDTWPGLDDRLLLNDGQGRFTDASAGAGLPGTLGKGLALVGGDWDDDGDPDLFVANDSQANLVLRNDGEGRFTDVGRMSGADLNGEGKSEACMGVDLGDLDGDGDLDLYVVNFEQETNTLYRNDGGGFFTDISVLSGAGAPTMKNLGFGARFLDVENDGDLDIYVANGHILDNVAQIETYTTYAQPDQLFLNDGRGRFELASAGAGPSLSVPRVGRGLARADLDGDGDDDLVVNNNDDRPWLLRNDAARGHRLVLRLTGPGGRADAEGARIEVTGGGRTLVREIVSGGSYVSHSDAEVVVGLGDLEVLESLTVRWPGGPTTVIAQPPVDVRLHLDFGADTPRAMDDLGPPGP